VSGDSCGAAVDTWDKLLSIRSEAGESEMDAGILSDDVKRLIREQPLGFFATVNPDGTPNLSPKGTTRVWDNDHLMFADLYSPGTVRNLRANPAIEINFVDPFVRKGYRLRGLAMVFTDGPEFETMMAVFRESMERADERIRSVIRVRITAVEPLVSPAYDSGASEESVVEQWKERWHQLYPR